MCSDKIPFKIKHLQKQFFCCAPIKTIDWKDVIHNISWHEQACLIDQTVNHSVIINYPVKISYQCSFVKCIIEQLEQSGTEVHDAVYEAYGNLISKGDGIHFSYKHYKINSIDKVLTLCESSNFISQGTTGLCTWPASLALSEWCLANKNRFENKTVLELGSGIGLTSLAVTICCDISEIYITDCHPSVLNLLNKNVKLNLNTSDFSDVTDFVLDDKVKVVYSTLYGLKKLSVLSLPWQSVENDNICGRIAPNYLLAADVVYDSSLFGPLCKTLTYFLTKRDDCVAIFACTVRNTSTLTEFLNFLETNGLTYKETEVCPQQEFIWSTESPIKIFEIRRA